MPETNGKGQSDNHEERITRREGARKEMEDALIVMAHLESKAATRIKEHAEFLANHQSAMLEFDGTNALIAIVGKMQGGIETKP